MRSENRPAVRDDATFTEAARRAQIIYCAIDAIAELGFNRASLSEIAKRARVSKSVVSYYFAGKDELIQHVVETVYATGAAFMIPRIESEGSMRGMLRAVITSNVEFIGANQREIRAITEIIANWRASDGSARFDNALQDRSERDIATLLREGQKNGEFGEFSPEVVAASIRASIDVLSWRLRADPALDVARFGEELAGLFERATAAPIPASNATTKPEPYNSRTKSKKEARHA